jgi:transcriptional regulator with XRE-family HTH domain
MEIDKKDFLIQVGQNIRKIRKSNGLSIEDLAINAEMEPRHLNKIELGQINTSIFQVYKISLKLKIELKEIFNFNKS